MQITVKFYATLGGYLPPNAKRNASVVTTDADATADSVIRQFHLPRKLVHLVMVNGHYVSPEDWATRALQPDDTIAIWPPVAGG